MSENSFGGLFFQATLPLEWIPLEEAGVPSASIEIANQNCLRIVMGMDEVTHETVDESTELNHELQRLDFKVNIILELVAQLASRDTELPSCAEIKLGHSALQWCSSKTPPLSGQTIQVKVYPDPRFPFPLILSGNVAAVTQIDDGYQVMLEIKLQSELTRELLEKYIFRCHRRHIAKMKSENSN